MPIASHSELEWLSLALLQPMFPPPKGIRLLGVGRPGEAAQALKRKYVPIYLLHRYQLEAAAKAGDAEQSTAARVRLGRELEQFWSELPTVVKHLTDVVAQDARR